MFAFTTDEGEVIKAADQAAAMVAGRLKSEYVGSTKIITIRIPLPLAVKLQALAQKSGKSRNATIATLLEVAIEEVTERLDSSTVEELEAIEQELWSDELQSLEAK